MTKDKSINESKLAKVNMVFHKMLPYIGYSLIILFLAMTIIGWYLYATTKECRYIPPGGRYSDISLKSSCYTKKILDKFH